METDRQHRQTVKQICKPDKQNYRVTGCNGHHRATDGQTDRQTDRQTDIMFGNSGLYTMQGHSDLRQKTHESQLFIKKIYKYKLRLV